MNIRAAAILSVTALVLCVPVAAQSADKETTKELIQTIIQAQKVMEDTLTRGAGSAKVTRSYKQVGEQPDPKKVSSKVGDWAFDVDFKISNGMQKVARYSIDPVSNARKDLEDVQITGPQTFWTYSPKENTAVSGFTGTVGEREYGTDYRPSMFNTLDKVPSAQILSRLVEVFDSLKPVYRSDGMLVLKADQKIPDGTEGKIELILDPNAGYCVVSFVAEGTVGQGYRKVVYNVDWQKVGDSFYPTKISYVVDWKRDAAAYGPGKDTIERCDIEITSFDPTAEISDSEFTVDSLGMAPGTIVSDNIVGANYRYKDRPAMEIAQKDLAHALAETEPAPDTSSQTPSRTSSQPTASRTPPVTIPENPNYGPVAASAVALLILAAVGFLFLRKSRRRNA